MASRQQQFVERVYQAARNIGLAEPQARLAATQAALETGYGKSVKGNNYFGIKAGSSWGGATQNFRTWEEVNGKRVNITDEFRAYATPEESLRDWVSLMERRYPEALQADTFEQATKALRYGQRGGYATDSQYGNKLSFIEREFLPDQPTMLAGLSQDQLPTPTPRYERGGILAESEAGSFSPITTAQAAIPPITTLPREAPPVPQASRPPTLPDTSARRAMTRDVAYGSPSQDTPLPDIFAPAPQSPIPLPEPDPSRFAPYASPAPTSTVAGYGYIPSPVPETVAQRPASPAQMPATPVALGGTALSAESFTDAELMLMDMTGELPQPVLPPVTPPALPPMPAQPMPVQQSTPSTAPAPPPPPPPSGMEVWQGGSDYGVATNGSELFRQSNGDIMRYNPEFDKTTLVGPDGKHKRMFDGRVEVAPQGGPEFNGLPNPFGAGLRPIDRTRGILAGGSVGGLPGAILGGLLAPALKDGINNFRDNRNFPSAPARPVTGRSLGLPEFLDAPRQSGGGGRLSKSESDRRVDEAVSRGQISAKSGRDIKGSVGGLF